MMVIDGEAVEGWEIILGLLYGCVVELRGCWFAKHRVVSSASEGSFYCGGGMPRNARRKRGQLEERRIRSHDNRLNFQNSRTLGK